MRRMLGFSVIAAGMLGVAAPAAAQSCVLAPDNVFFDHDSATINAAAVAILDKVAAAYLACSDAQIVLSGHTDRVGGDQYNVGRSQRMVANVRAYLVARGVPEAAITTQAFGESRPAIDTADGLREPQNRRVEITFGPGSGW